MQYSRKPLAIGDRFMWSGEIAVPAPRAYGVIAGENAAVDYVIDEGVLIYKSDRGLVIVTGCGHRGIVNIVRHCQKITGIDRIHALIGGFHLRCASRARSGTSAVLRQHQPEKIMGCHCTGTGAGYGCRDLAGHRR